MKDTRRIFLILSILVRLRQWTTAQEIRRRLPKRYRTHVRSIQRDLVTLKRWMPLQVDRIKKPYHWMFVHAPCPCCWK